MDERGSVGKLSCEGKTHSLKIIEKAAKIIFHLMHSQRHILTPWGSFTTDIQ